MKQKEYTWYKIAESVDQLHFGPNGLTGIEVNGKTVCIARQQNSIAACSQKCPHAGGNMSDGFVDALGNIICPLHGYRFSAKNGRNISGEGYFIKIFPINILETGVFIGFEENN